MEAATRPPLGGTPGGKSRASKDDPGETSPGSDSGVKGEAWAVMGFLEEKPADPMANQVCADVLDYDKRVECDPKKRFPLVKEKQRGEIEPLKSEWV